MKKLLSLFLICTVSVFLFGAKKDIEEKEGYKGVLPELKIEQPAEKKMPPKSEFDVLPLDKLTMPVMQPVKIDKREVAYKRDVVEVKRQLERLKEILDNDKSFKNFIAAANMLNLQTNSMLNEYKEERFYENNKKLSYINHDVQKVKIYWLQVNRYSSYVTKYETNNAYSPKVLNDELNKFSYRLGFAIRNIKEYLGEKE